MLVCAVVAIPANVIAFINDNASPVSNRRSSFGNGATNWARTNDQKINVRIEIHCTYLVKGILRSLGGEVIGNVIPFTEVYESFVAQIAVVAASSKFFSLERFFTKGISR
jgi:hypothetical protein